LNNEEVLSTKKAEILKIIEEKLKQSACRSTKPRKDQFIKSSKEKTLQIFNINKPYNQMNLKSKILSSESFVCLVKFSSSHYIALVSEPKFKVKDNVEFKCHINIIDSRKENPENLKKLSWLESNLNNCEYKLNNVECPSEQLTANNSLLHAYVNASAAKWALENNLWPFLKENFYRQNFSTSRNAYLYSGNKNVQIVQLF
jgi:hypothetical protein